MCEAHVCALYAREVRNIEQAAHYRSNSYTYSVLSIEQLERSLISLALLVSHLVTALVDDG